jgi:uncharacterized protein
MKNGFLLYDTHAHLGLARHSGRRHEAEDLLRHMDDAGVDRAMLIPFPVVDDHRVEHDKIAAAVRRYPDRFAGAACLYPFLHEAEFHAELQRCADMGFRALKLQPQYHGLNPVSARNDFYFAAAAERKLPLIVHTGSGAPFALPSLYILAATKYPDLPVILGHAGGSIYFLEAVVAASICPNIYIELSSLMPHHITEVLAHVPADRLMVGSDLPESLPAEMHKILSMNIPEEDKLKILWATPRRILDGHP